MSETLATPEPREGVRAAKAAALGLALGAVLLFLARRARAR